MGNSKSSNKNRSTYNYILMETIIPKEEDIDSESTNNPYLINLINQLKNKQCSIDTISEYIQENKSEIYVIDKCGNSPLMQAVKAARTEYMFELIKLLLENGALVNKQNNMGSTPLMYAARYSNHIKGNNDNEIIKLLLDKGADPNIQDMYGWTALMYAAKYSTTNSSLDTVQLLLDRGANPKLETIKGNTALSISIYLTNKSSSLDAIKLLVDYGSYLNTRDKGGWTPLIRAVRHTNDNCTIETIQFLLDLGVDVNEQDDIGWTPAMHAACYSREESSLDTLKLLVSYGAKLNIRNKYGDTAFVLAARNYGATFVEYGKMKPPSSTIETVKYLVVMDNCINFAKIAYNCYDLDKYIY